MYSLAARVADQARVLMQLHLYNHGSADEGGCGLRSVHIWHFRRSDVFTRTTFVSFFFVHEILIVQWTRKARNNLKTSLMCYRCQYVGIIKGKTSLGFVFSFFEMSFSLCPATIYMNEKQKK